MKRLIFTVALAVSATATSQVTEAQYMDMLMASSIREYKQVNFDSLVNVTIAKINDLRVKNNLNKLQIDNILNTYSKNWSDKCMSTTFRHSNLTANGISAENMHYSTAVGAWILGKDLFYSIPDDIYTGWFNSAGHKKNMLMPNVTKIGLSISTQFDGNDYKLISVMVIQ